MLATDSSVENNEIVFGTCCKITDVVFVKEPGFCLRHMILTQPLCIMKGESRVIENFVMLRFLFFFSDHIDTAIKENIIHIWKF
jgi:hypothetical protein